MLALPNERRPLTIGSGPIQTGFLPHPLLEVAQQTTDYIPAVAQSHLDVAMLVHANNRIVSNSRTGQIFDVQFVVFHNPGK